MDMTLTAPSDRCEVISDRLAVSALKRVALVGNFPPRRCGIATFTSDVYLALKAAFPRTACDVYAMNDDGGPYAYGEAVTFGVRQAHSEDYLEAARRINLSGAELLNLQHEFGIFGGPAGEEVLRLLTAVRCPVVTTLHTVLTDPNADQRRVMRALIQRSSKLMVMAQKGKDILRRVYGVPADKIAVIPHGAPDRPLVQPDEVKAAFGLQGRKVLFTFGLLSPNKGIEVMIRALPPIVAKHPDTTYVVLGATHPHLIAHEGEAYRERLMDLAQSLGVGDNVRFWNEFCDTSELLDRLQAADVYITPYLGEAQITSGTLSYAVALGKAVVSTPYWHAQELLADGVGRLTPFGDVDALTAAVVELLDDADKRRSLQTRAYEKGRSTIWPQVARDYMETFKDARSRMDHDTAADGRVRPAAVRLDAVERLTDSCGIFQHSLYGVPDRRHGYCIDDNARALILAVQSRSAGGSDARADRLAWIYASFIQYAWNGEAGRFRNFMSYDRQWLESVGSEDSGGRGLWAIGVAAESAAVPEVRRWARALGEDVLPHFDRTSALRMSAFAILGLIPLMRAGVGGERTRQILRRHADFLVSHLDRNATPQWPWFEAHVSYDNARLPEALVRAGLALDDAQMTRKGVDSLAWLTQVQTAPSGVFRPVGTHSFGVRHAVPDAFDQQPLEAAATVDACAAAHQATDDPRWITEARRAYEWYVGRNDLGVRLAQTQDGACYDGLGVDGPNLNQGAESVLALQMAAYTLQELLARHKAPVEVAVRH